MSPRVESPSTEGTHMRKTVAALAAAGAGLTLLLQGLPASAARRNRGPPPAPHRHGAVGAVHR